MRWLHTKDESTHTSKLRAKLTTQVLAEVDRVVGDRAPTIDEMKQLNYTRMVLGESLRLYPQVRCLRVHMCLCVCMGHACSFPGLQKWQGVLAAT